MATTTVKVKDPETGVWGVAAVAKDGARGLPGAASPYTGSLYATSLQAFGAEGDGTTDDTADVNRAITAAGEDGYLDGEWGEYRVTSDLEKAWWGLFRRGPAEIVGPGGEVVFMEPFADADTTTIYVNGDTGDDANSGLFASAPLRTLAAVRNIFEVSGPVMGGNLIVRLSGTITGGVRFQNPPLMKQFIRFEGDALDAFGLPTTWIENDPEDAERFGLRFEEGQQMRVHLKALGFRGFNVGGGMGWLMKSGGFIRTEDCATDGCQIGSGYVGNVGFSEQRSHHEGYTISGTRAQYSASGSWTRVTCQGSAEATEGFHVSRNSVAHVDICTSTDHERDGIWADMNTRMAVTGSTLHRNGREGVRGEGGAEIHIDDTTNGPTDFGLGTANQNKRRGVGLYGMARLTATESVYGITDKKIDSWRGSVTTERVAARGLAPYRVGIGARLGTRTWGTGTGSVAFKIGGRTAATLPIPATMTAGWIAEFSVEVANVGSTPFWVGYATLNGGSTVMVQMELLVEECRVAVTPTGVAVRGAEHSTGG